MKNGKLEELIISLRINYSLILRKDYNTKLYLCIKLLVIKNIIISAIFSFFVALSDLSFISEFPLSETIQVYQCSVYDQTYFLLMSAVQLHRHVEAWNDDILSRRSPIAGRVQRIRAISARQQLSTIRRNNI